MTTPENETPHAELQDQGTANDHDPKFDLENTFADLGAIDAQNRGEPTEDEQQAEAQSQAAELDPAAAVGMVEMGLCMGEMFIANSSGLAFAFPEAQKDKFVESCGPLMAKHGATWLGWFDKYKEELVFGGAAFGLAMTSYNQLRHLNAEQLAKLAKEQEAANDGKQEKTNTAEVPAAA